LERELIMAGNSNRRGAVKKSSKGNPTAGSGGRRRKGLEGKGPTPKAEDRPYHKQYKMARAAERRAAGKPRRKSGGGKPTDSGPEWVAGRNAVAELLQADVPIAAIHVAEDARRDERISEIFRLAAERHVALLEVPRSELDKFTGAAVHQGVAAKLEAYDYAHPDDLLQAAAERGEPPLVVMLDGVTDPRNLGAVIRSAAGFGAHGVVIAERRAASMTASAWKASAGAAARVAVARATNLTRQLKAYQAAGLMVIGLAADGDVALPDLELGDGPLVVVIGSEGKGLSRLVSETCDQLVSIPTASSLESLNAGVAAGIALYAIAQSRPD
jgi:23S rRNA (guanosine2251-2'-O)-methyltransferase